MSPIVSLLLAYRQRRRPALTPPTRGRTLRSGPFSARFQPERQWFAVTPALQGNTCVVGLQWGDEGKGKIVDLIAESADVVVRYCGGTNAGHTVRFNGQKYSTHLLPVGVFRPHVMNLIGNGVVLDPEA